MYRIKKTIVILIITSIFFIICSCQPTPDKQVVIAKDNYEQISESASNGQGTNISNPFGYWKENEIILNDITSISINAKIIVPETKEFPLYNTSPWMPEGEELKNIIKILFGEKKVFKFDTMETKDHWEKVLLNLERNNFGNEKSSNNETIDQVKKWAQDAPEYTNFYDPTYQYEKDNSNSLFINISAINENNDALPYLTCSKTNDRNFGIIQYSTLSINKYIITYVGNNEQQNEINTGKDEVKRLALEIFEKISGGHVQVEDISIAYIDDVNYFNASRASDNTKNQYKDNSTLEQVYSVTLIRTINNIPVLCEDSYYTGHVQSDGESKEYIQKWNDEKITMYINDNGLIQMCWEYPCKEEDMITSNATLLSFDKIKDIIINHLKLKNTFSAQLIKQQNISIEEIQLGYMRMMKINQPYQYMFVPIWKCYGTVTTSMEGMNEQTQKLEKIEKSIEQDILLVNAIDGSIISSNDY